MVTAKATKATKTAKTTKKASTSKKINTTAATEKGTNEK